MTLTREDELGSRGLQGGTSPAFDWYSCTLSAELDGHDVIDTLQVELGGDLVRCVGRHGYAERAALLHGRRSVVSVSYGGAHDRCHVETTGGDAERLVPLIRRHWPDHRVTRVDSAMDWDDRQGFDRLSKCGLSVKRAFGLKSRLAGDWIDGVDGRTLYLGGKAAAVEVRSYEKGKQIPEAGRPDWCRAECQVRPPKLAGKLALASVDAAGVWGAARWSRGLFEALQGLPVARVDMRGWVPPDDARAYRFLVQQYGPLARRVSSGEYGGSGEAFARALLADWGIPW